MKGKYLNILIGIFICCIIFLTIFLLLRNKTPKVILSVANSSLSLYEEEKKEIEYSIENGEKSLVQFVSSDPSVAIVDSNGIVTGVQEGNCEITLSYEDMKALLIVFVKFQ